MDDFSELVSDDLIEFSVSRSALRLTRELRQEVAGAAASVGAGPEAEALALWLMASPSAERQPGPALPVVRFSAWILSRGSQPAER